MSKRLISLVLLLLFFSCTKKYPEQQFLQAERLHGEHRYQEEAELYELMLLHRPQGPEAPKVALRMAEIYERFLGDKAKGLEVYASLANEWRGSPEAVTSLERRAGIYEGNEEYPLAVAEYERLLDQGKSPHDKVLYRLASCHLKMKDYHRARGELLQLLREFPKSEWTDEAWLDLGEGYFLENRFREAFEAYQKLLQNAPTSPLVPQASLSLAMSLEELGEWDRALKIYEELLPTYPNQKMINLKIQKLRERQQKIKR